MICRPLVMTRPSTRTRPLSARIARAKFTFVTVAPGQPVEAAGLKIDSILQDHSHGSYGYRFDDGKKVVVYSTDSEHKIDDMVAEAQFESFFRNADLVISDTMYSLADSVTMKQDWGHSSNIVAVDLCHLAAAKRLVLFHHEPTYSDRDIERMFHETVRYEELTREDRPVLDIVCAYDGLELEI